MNVVDPLTHVMVCFFDCSKDDVQTPCTEVHVIHSGWRNSPNWEEAGLWFKKAWDFSLEKLREET